MEEAPGFESENDDAEPTTGQNTLLAALRSKWEALGEAKFYDYALPGYDELLKVRFTNTLSWTKISDIMKRAEKNKKNPMATLYAQCDIIANCTDSFWACAEIGAPYGRMDNQTSGMPAAWPEVAAMMGLQAPSAREAIRGLIRQDLRVAAMTQDVMNWIQMVDDNAGEEVQGES